MKFKYLLTTGVFLSASCLSATANDDRKNCVDVAIFSINDFHGSLVPAPEKGLPGAPSLVETMDSLKSVYPYHLAVTAGDNFGGSFFYKETIGHTLMPQFFKDMGIQISAIGNHEFDDGQPAMEKKWKDAEIYPHNWNFEYVCANCRYTNGKIPDYITPCKVDSVALGNGKFVKIGFVGLLTSNTPNQASKRNLKGLTFDGDYPGVLDSIRHTEAYRPVADADIRVILTHIGTISDEKGQPVWEDKDMPNLYNIDDPSYHAIISSHSHKLVCGKINKAKYPIVQGESNGKYICCLKFTIDTTTMKVVDAVPSVHPVTYKKKLGVKARRLQAQIEEQLATTLTPAGVPIGTRLTVAKNDIKHDREHKHRQAIIGNWVCASYAECARKAARLSDKDIVVGVSHIGSIRSGFAKGPVSVLDVGEVLPFANNIRLFKVSGAQLEELIEFGLHNEKYGYIQMGNLQFKQNKKGKVSELTYVAPDQSRRTIQAKDECYLAADEFMTNGGDGYSPSFFPATQEIKDLDMPQTTDAFINYLKSQPFIEDPNANDF